MDHQTINNAILRSQHCQRNWDLTREIPNDDLNLLVTAATQCPSKQNVAFYNLNVIKDRNLIESIHEHTKGFTVNYAKNLVQTNSQVLANMLFIFEDKSFTMDKDTKYRNQQTFDLLKTPSDEVLNTLNRDKNIAIGIAAGYVNLTASLLGYVTGFCSCFDEESIKTLLGLSNQPLLLMGIGYENHNLNRCVHHQDHNFVYPTKPKQTINVNFY